MTALSLPEVARKKLLGQYFTHQRVGRLLAALACADSARTIIDPMVGSADLLLSCLAVGAKPARLVGFELDPVAFAQAEAALSHVPGADLALGDAFSTVLPADQFDLVITNPPYIRYQATGDVSGLTVPSSDSVRAGLLRAIQRRGLSGDARRVLAHFAAGYPATADTAVPAWILSASLVREGGMLAVVAPQAWLSRNYAHAVRALLDELFDVEVIVEDGDASWFDDAQVRTQLVVARRRPPGERASGSSVVIARATRDLNTNSSLKGSLPSELALAAALRNVTTSNSVAVTTGLTAHVEQQLSLTARGRVGHIPARVAATLGAEVDVGATRTIESYGWRAGQGLRTGANDFFYVNAVGGMIRPAARWAIRSLPIPTECLLPAVRRQSELGPALAVDDAALTGRVVNLRGWVTATDMKRMARDKDVQVLPDSVCTWIDRVAATPLSANRPTKLFPLLAAVAPNTRTDDYGRPVSFWYQLPGFAPRHRPQLLVGRVCGGQPTAYLNAPGTVVDANFSTLWSAGPDALPAEALLALLNSSWTWGNLEASCTVLGGGALKVEATDLRRLALPDLTASDISQLVQWGRTLVTDRTTALIKAIDDAVTAALSPAHGGRQRGAGLREFASQALRHRSRK